MPPSSNSAISKGDILQLYRRCLRSASKIPDPNQRATYFVYVKDGFRRSANLFPDSREMLVAYRDGLEQVEQMEYYQRMAMVKRENEYNNSALRANFLNQTSAVESSGAAIAQLNNYSRIENENFHFLNGYGLKKSPSGDILSEPDPEVKEWLLSHLPHLRQEDLEKYTQSLIEEGFDNVDFIKEELMEEDLLFMKRAHRRVLMRQVSKTRENLAKATKN